jgi:hypothetical protein
VRTSNLTLVFLLKKGPSTSKVTRNYYSCLGGRNVLFGRFKLRSVGLAGTRGALMCTRERIGKILLVRNIMKIARITVRVNFAVLE